MRVLFLVATVALCAACRTGNRAPARSPVSPIATPEDGGSLVLTPAQKQALRERFQGNPLMIGVFPPERVFRLRESEVVIAQVNDVVWTGTHLYVMDTMQQRIFHFDADGHYVGEVGRKGQGPGEFQIPQRIQAIWGDQLAVLDGAGRLLVFDADGTFRFGLKQSPTIILPRGAFDWPSQDRLVAGDFICPLLDEPLIKVLDYSNLDAPRETAAFETRHDIRRLGSYPRRAFTAMSLVGDQVWSAPAYESRFRIFDAAGKLVKDVALGSDPALDFDTYVDVVGRNMSVRDKHAMLNAYEYVVHIVPAGPVVVLQTSRGYRLFDREGKALAPLLLYFPGMIYPGHDGRIVWEIPTLRGEEGAESFFKSIPEAAALMEAQGFDLHGTEDDVYLHVGRFAL